MMSLRINALRPQRSPITGLALTLGLLATACSTTESEPVAAGNLEMGADVYAKSCASCHGDDLRGTDKGPSHLSIVYQPGHHPDPSFESAIQNGTPSHHWNFGDMPAIPGLSDEEISAVIAFVRSEQERLGFEQ